MVGLPERGPLRRVSHRASRQRDRRRTRPQSAEADSAAGPAAGLRAVHGHCRDGVPVETHQRRRETYIKFKFNVYLKYKFIGVATYFFYVCLSKYKCCMF